MINLGWVFPSYLCWKLEMVKTNKASWKPDVGQWLTEICFFNGWW